MRKSAARQKLAVGFVGGGWVSCNRHMPAAKAQPELELIGMVSRETHLHKIDRPRLTGTFGLQHYSSDLSVSWFRGDVDVAVIGTPPDTHYELVMNCLRMGKHVLVEKPFAMTVGQAEEMVSAAKTAGLQLGLVHNFQFSTACRRARRLYETGELGELRGVLGFQSSNHKRRLPTWYKELPMGLFTDESPHLIYLLRAFLGDPMLQSVFVGPPLAEGDNTPRQVTAQFASRDGITASLHMFFKGALSEWHFVLFGSKRTLLVDLFRDVLVELPDDDGHRSLDVLRTSWSGILSHVAGFLVSGVRHVTGRIDYGNKEVFRRFVSSVLEGGPLSGITGEDGRAVVKIMEEIRSHAEPLARQPSRNRPS